MQFLAWKINEFCPFPNLRFVYFLVAVSKLMRRHVQVGVLIGKAGETIRYLQFNSGAKIQITRDAEADPNSTTRSVELIGAFESINKAEKLIKDVIAEVYFLFASLSS